MKSSTSGIPNSIEDLKQLHGARQSALRARLEDFARVKREEWFYELAYCLLTPQSSAVHADAVVQKLREANFDVNGNDPEPFLREPSTYIRFHKTKTKHLLRARSVFASVAAELSNGKSPGELRSWLAGHVPGLGLKEATHFLRNIGMNGTLAILDRHILRNLHRFGAIASVPDTLTPARYFSIEGQFQAFASSVGIPVNELDLLFWSMETGEIRK